MSDQQFPLNETSKDFTRHTLVHSQTLLLPSRPLHVHLAICVSVILCTQKAKPITPITCLAFLRGTGKSSIWVIDQDGQVLFLHVYGPRQNRTSLVNKGFIIWDKTPKHD